MTTETKTIYSCRAELTIDADRFLEKAAGSVVLRRRGGNRLTLVEFESALTIEELRAIMRSITDLHVMRQSLRPCAMSENDGSRDRSID